jgi:hypothetical protein
MPRLHLFRCEMVCRYSYVLQARAQSILDVPYRQAEAHKAAWRCGMPTEAGQVGCGALRGIGPFAW